MNIAVPLLHDYLLASAERLPTKEALVCQGLRLTYADLDARSNALAHALVRRGIERGDRVIVFLENSIEAVVAFWAVLKANAVVVMVHPTTKADKLAYLLNDCRARGLVTSAQLGGVATSAVGRSEHLATVVVAGKADLGTGDWGAGAAAWNEACDVERTDAPPARRAIDVDLAAIIYTSGSTGEPKGVMLTHRNMLAAATSISTYLQMRDDDIVLNVLPMSFDYGLYQMIMTFRVGARLVLEKSFAYPARVLKIVTDEKVTGFPGVPTIFAMLADMKTLGTFDFGAIRFVTNTAAALPVKHILMLKDIFPTARIYSMYGLTECKRCTYLPPEDLDRKPTSVGVAIPNTEMWIVDEDGQRVPHDTVGQLVIRGATVMVGYWEKPEQTAKKLRPLPHSSERVLYTGDYCRMDEEGYLYFVGRIDDIIKSRGEKIAPKEVEAILYSIPGVKEAAVIGADDEILGQVPKAFLVFQDGSAMDERELRRLCQERMESFMVPKYFEFRDELPKSQNGKIDKLALA